METSISTLRSVEVLPVFGGVYGRCRRVAGLRPNDSAGGSGRMAPRHCASKRAMPALAEIDLGTLAP